MTNFLFTAETTKTMKEERRSGIQNWTWVVERRRKAQLLYFFDEKRAFIEAKILLDKIRIFYRK